MVECATPACHRTAILNVHALLIFNDADQAPMCVACWLAFEDGFRRHSADVTWKIRDDVDADDLQKIDDHLIP